MHLMDVTPQELRDIDIREGFRGYNRDDVDELLERAAGTIEHVQESARRLEEQKGQAREAEDILQRTLLLAQRAADEAVAEAQAKSRQMLDEAETTARATLAEAEHNARRQAEAERRRLESEILELGARREALLADVNGLERFEAEYRARLRRSVETDLESLGGTVSVAPSPRPTIHDVELPAAAPGAASATSPTAAPPAPPAAEPEAQGAPTAEIGSVPVWTEPAVDPGAPSVHQPPPDVPPLAPSSPSAERPPLFDREPAEAESLDDEAFFASLREAVTDETPLGPRDDQPQPERALFDQDDARSGSGRFGRNRP
ncbi:MAG: DivIVA domain-containing protein [Actinobacteria bacterium]|nr:DivIVA domain-containing protein [Actinomycetota bacterium]